MPIKLCATCGGRFNADQDWKRECFQCWKKMKWWEEERGRELLDLRGRVARLNTEVARLNVVLNRMKREQQEVPSWISEHRRWLIQKLHPDKHGGSAIANEIVQQLIEGSP